MFDRLFGCGEEQQLKFLGWRTLVTIIGIPASIISEAVGSSSSTAALILAAVLLMWGWGVVKSLFGLTTFGAIFSGNVVIGVILFMLYFMLAFLCGMLFGFLGVARWIYLKITYCKS